MQFIGVNCSGCGGTLIGGSRDKVFGLFKWDMWGVMGVMVCVHCCANVLALNMLNANGLCCVFPSFSLQMADCGGMPQVDQVCMSVFM